MNLSTTFKKSSVEIDIKSDKIPPYVSNTFVNDGIDLPGKIEKHIPSATSHNTSNLSARQCARPSSINFSSKPHFGTSDTFKPSPSQ
ncbi:hypothetical protein M8J77_014887 [Diaphorina citri]|nr:hypothetical protein M8J77_014887 [Diaphorina citri]